MKFLLLRGQVPTDRPSSEIVFEHLKDVDDMWSLLFASFLSAEDEGEIWYWGGNRKHRFAKNLTERWVPSFANYKSAYTPDVIFCRGGFPEYHHILKKFPNAFKIYYGAGRRFLPQPGFHDYDLVLQDSIPQVKECREKFPNLRAELFIKPAADNLFYPKTATKEYDVCFPANWAQNFKGHDFVYATAPNDLKILNLGNNPRQRPIPKSVTSHKLLRPQMAAHIAKCKVGIVAANSPIDSCPRVIPEMLACGLPIVVLKGTRFWTDKYINSVFSSSSPFSTGEVAEREDFWDTVRHVLENIDNYSPREYYITNLSLKIAANYIKNLIVR